MSDINYDRFMRRVFKAVGREADKAGISLGEFSGGVLHDDEHGEIVSFAVSVNRNPKELH